MKRILTLGGISVAVALTTMFAVQGLGGAPTPLILFRTGTVVQLFGTQGYATPYSSTFTVAASGHLIGAWVADHGVFWLISSGGSSGFYSLPALLPSPSNGSLDRRVDAGTWSLVIVHGEPANVTVTRTIEVVYP